MTTRASRTIRTLLIAPSMKIVGGQSIQADRLLEAFAGHPQVHMRLCPIDPPIPAVLQRIPYLRTVLRAPVYYVRMLDGILTSDVIHAFTSSFWGYTLWVIPAICLSRLFGRKIVVNYHDGRAELHLRDWASAVSTLRRADAIVVPSEYLVTVFAKFGLSASAISNVVDLTQFRFRQRTHLRPVFLTNRGMETLYNVDCTIRAFRLIQDRYPGAQFIIANDGPLRSELESLAGELELKNVRFTGAVSQEAMAELYDEADIYVMSPLIDNMPVTVLECFASGVPVVSTDSGGVPFMAQNERNALLVPAGSPERLASACFRLLEEDGLALRLAAEGFRDCERHYTAGSVMQKWEQLYRQLCGISEHESATVAR